MAERKIKYQGLSTLEVLVEAKNYNNWIADEVKAHLTPPVLEIGAGTGNLSSYCLTVTPLHITDNDAGLVTRLKRKFKKEKNVFVSLFDITKKVPQKFKQSFSTVFAINVLEHIKDDLSALQNINTMLKRNGKLVLLVPAKKFAYTKLDKEIGHFRRYEKKDLTKKLEKTGYQVEKIYFFNIVGLFSWYIRDKVKRKNIALKPYHIALFDSIVPLLRLIESFIKFPLGISLIVVATKKI